MNSMFLSLLNLKAAVDTRFTVLAGQGPFELRYYQRMVCAKVNLPGTYEDAVKNGMQYLLDYIGGNNFKVLQIKNYGHLFHIHKVNSWDVGLILPAEISAPKPINRLIKIEELPPGKVATLRFNGPLNSEIIERRGEDLRKWLNFRHMNSNGPLTVARHDSLFPFSFLNVNEVQMEVGLL